jgi:uncharacterized protein (TIGR03083 family)
VPKTSALLPGIAAERRAVADMMDDFTAGQWATPSLCTGWTVRHVAAHLVMPFNVSLPQMMLGMARAKGNFNLFADRFAKKWAGKPTGELIADLRRNAGHPFSPPGAGHEAPLTDIIVHGLDMRRALSIERDVPADRLNAVLDTLMAPRNSKFFKRDNSGVRFVANDIGWSTGTGPTVEGAAQDLALHLAGRRSAIDALTGDGVAIERARAK